MDPGVLCYYEKNLQKENVNTIFLYIVLKGFRFIDHKT